MIEYYFLMWKVYYNLEKKIFCVDFVIIVALFCHWCSKKAMNKIRFRERCWETGMFNTVFLCLCNNWRHWCEVGENLLFQIAEVNYVHSVDYQISLEYLVLKMFELTSTIHVTCMILIFSLQLNFQILSINLIMSLISILVWLIGEKL